MSTTTIAVDAGSRTSLRFMMQSCLTGLERATDDCTSYNAADSTANQFPFYRPNRAARPAFRGRLGRNQFSRREGCFEQAVLRADVDQLLQVGGHHLLRVRNAMVAAVDVHAGRVFEDHGRLGLVRVGPLRGL